METSTRIIDCHSKSHIVGQKNKNNITGSNLRKTNPNIPPNDIPIGHEFMVASLKTRGLLLIIGETIFPPT